MVPPGMGELNYIQTLLSGLIDQTLYTTSSPTFAALTLSGLTASALVGTNASKQLQTVNPGTSLSLSGTSLNTIQGIRTVDSPTFAGLTIGTLTGILKAASGVVAAATIGTSLSYSAPTLNTIQGIRTADSPQFTSLSLVSTANNLPLLSVGASGRSAQWEFRRGASNASTYIGPGSVNILDIWCQENIPFRIGLNAAEVLTITAAGLINPKATTSIGLSNPAQTYFLRLICGSAITADRNLTFATGDAARTLTLSGNPTLNDWFDQAVKAASSPSFASLKLTTSPTVGKIWKCTNVDGSGGWDTETGGMVYPGAGIPISTGSAWGTSLDLAEQRILGRITGGIMAGLTDSQVRTLLGLATGDSPTFTGATFSGLTASLPVVTGGTSALATLSYASWLANAGVGVAWTTPSYDSANFVGGSSMTWTVESGDVTTYAWMMIGAHTMLVALYIGPGTIGGTPDLSCKIKIPNSKTATKTIRTGCLVYDNLTAMNGILQATAGDTWIYCFKSDVSNWTAGTNVNYVMGTITFEVN